MKRVKRYVVQVLAQTYPNVFLVRIRLNTLLFEDYQRDALAKHKIKQVFRQDWMPPIVCNLRDGQIYCIDGRQRSSHLEKLGITECYAYLHVGLTYQEEAKLFFELNDIPAKMAGWKKFYSALRAGNQTNRLILDTIHKHNLTVPGDPQVAKAAHADVKNVAVMLQAWTVGGIPLVNTVCHVLSNAFRVSKNGPVQEAAKQYDFCRGMIQFLHETDVDLKIFCIIMRRMTPEGIREIAKKIPSKGRIDAAQIKAAFGQAYQGRKVAA